MGISISCSLETYISHISTRFLDHVSSHESSLRLFFNEKKRFLMQMLAGERTVGLYTHFVSCWKKSVVWAMLMAVSDIKQKPVWFITTPGMFQSWLEAVTLQPRLKYTTYSITQRYFNEFRCTNVVLWLLWKRYLKNSEKNVENIISMRFKSRVEAAHWIQKSLSDIPIVAYKIFYANIRSI